MRIIVRYQNVRPPVHFERLPGFPFWTVGVTIAGRLRLSQGAHTIVDEPGMVSVVQPDTPYRLAVTEGRRQIEYYSFLAKPPHWRMWENWPESMPGRRCVKVVGTPVWEQVLAAFATACEHSDTGEMGEELAFNAIERALLLATSVHPGSQRPVMDERIGVVVAYARDRLGEKLDVAALAQAAHLSPSRLAHLFTEKMGESPMSHLEGLRMRRAQELLLSTALPVREIARRVGYENPYHFSDRFRSRIGRSPRAFRRQPA